MAGLEFRRSGFLFIGNGQQQEMAFDFGRDPNVFSWIRPSVYFHAFTDRDSRLQYVAEHAYWDGGHPIPPFWSLALRSTGNSQFVFTMALVTP
ncbi:hypothetical protein NLX86_32880 [Streptomyces sp. A3M-1-3]|uniref:hypothetical protein n=1 Tax=Streptomyces sp. A3M-1-3 TaxID=2962044 RepID=UPI0020B6DEE6|nr:hypothetical protein [Streptomyces sp. A3M-1-3]MCP3822708.1 hypothetical protein [Streptomyces sp. A3M-1-3]